MAQTGSINMDVNIKMRDYWSMTNSLGSGGGSGGASYVTHQGSGGFINSDPRYIQTGVDRSSLTDRDLHRIADELAYRNPRWRGCDPREIRDVVETLAHFVPRIQAPIENPVFEDLFNQAMLQIEILTDGDSDDPDVVALLDRWDTMNRG